MKCRICGCTDERGCPGGCEWVEVELCSICSEFRCQLEEYVANAARVTPGSMRRLLTEVENGD